MEFKNFEDKLIIEKLTNYCIENNISVNEINALTAKIKFGRLDEANSWFGNTLAYMGTGTSTQKYNYAIKTIQNDLQKAMDSLNAAHKNLTGTENIFDKYKISMPNDKKQDLINAVTQLKTAIDQYTPDVKTSLQNVGGQVSGASNFGDEGSSIDFDIVLPELKSGGPLEIAFNKAFYKKSTVFNTIKSQIYKNISNLSKKIDPSQVPAIIQKIQLTIKKAIENLDKGKPELDYMTKMPKPNTGDPKLLSKTYTDLLVLANKEGLRLPDETSSPTGTTPPPTITNLQKTNLLNRLLNVRGDIHPEVEKVITTTLKNYALELMHDILKANKNINQLKDAWNKAVDNTPSAKEGTTDTKYDKTAQRILDELKDNLEL